MVISSYFIKSIKKFQDRIAIESKNSGRWESLTYGQLGEKVQSVAYFISSLGIKKGDRVAVILENRTEWGIIFFALSYIGAVAVPLDPQGPEEHIKNILYDSGAESVFIAKENQRLHGFFGALEGIKHVIVIGLEREERTAIPIIVCYTGVRLSLPQMARDRQIWRDTHV